MWTKEVNKQDTKHAYIQNKHKQGQTSEYKRHNMQKFETSIKKAKEKDTKRVNSR